MVRFDSTGKVFDILIILEQQSDFTEWTVRKEEELQNFDCQHFVGLEKLHVIDHLPIRKKGPRRVRPISTSLVTVENPENPLHFSENSKPNCAV